MVVKVCFFLPNLVCHCRRFKYVNIGTSNYFIFVAAATGIEIFISIVFIFNLSVVPAVNLLEIISGSHREVDEIKEIIILFRFVSHRKQKSCESIL